MRNALDYVGSFTEQMAVKGDHVVPFYNVVRDKIVTKTGSDIIKFATGERVIEFEWSSKSIYNIMWAI